MKKSSIIIFILLLIPTISFTETHIPGGDVSGIWTFDNSPYIIDGQILLQSGDELVIEPGVQVLFSGHYKFDIYGRLLAEGTENDTIIFTAIDTTTGWHTMKFWNTNGNGQDSTKLVYCKFEYAKSSGSNGGAIYCGESSDILIKNCLITKNIAHSGGGIGCFYSSPCLDNVTIKGNTAEYGGGIYCNNSNPSFTNITITGNNSYGGDDSGGGGIYCYSSNPIITNVTIIENNANNGSGIYCKYSSPILTNVSIIGNTAVYNGGGIYCRWYSDPVLINVKISENTAGCDGGGIYCYRSDPDLTDVKISENTAEHSGGGIYCYSSSDPNLTNVIITENIASDDGGGIYCRYSDPILNNVLIKGNSAYSGGGIYCYDSSPSFDSVNRCNIFFNCAVNAGKDLYANYENQIIDVIVDTFSVLYPNDYFAYPFENYTFDILNSKIEQINQDLYVSPTGSNSNSGLTPDDPFLTISWSLIMIIANSTNPHIIHLANGNYSPSQTGETFPLYCRSYLSFQGEDEYSTILDGEGLSNILYCNNDSCFSIENLTIQNGNAKYGGGIYCNFSSPCITNVTINGNIVSGYSSSGGGIYCKNNSNPDLYNVEINGNTADKGGGIYCMEHSSPTLSYVTITGNIADGYGGGVYCGHSSILMLENVIISENTADGYGGGIYSVGSNPFLTNVIISENIASGYPGYGGGICCNYSNPCLANVTINGNIASGYNGSGGGIYCSSSNPILDNVTIIENTADEKGGGIYCKYNSNPILANVTITENSSESDGGGIYIDSSSPVFDTLNLCNIFLNSAELGYDLYSYESPTINVVVDTFTVLYPNDYIAYPVDNFTFDILHSKIEQVNQDLYVSPTGSNNNSGLTPEDPLLTISYALIKIIADSTNPHTINLVNGTYSPSQTGETFPLYCISYISFQGEDESSTILDGEGLSNILYCDNDSCFSIENLTIYNGSANYGGGIYMYASNLNLLNVTVSENTTSGFFGFSGGAGIYCGYNSNSTFENVTITGNNAYTYGGGIYCDSCSAPGLTNVNIYGNSASWGGGICCHSSCPILYNVTIAENTAYEDGGGIFCRVNSNPNLVNVIIYGNTANTGGGIYCENSNPILDSITISGNHADNNGGGIYCIDNAAPILENVIITGNIASGHYGFGGGIYCINNSNPSLSNVTISENIAKSGGGGLYVWNSIPVFDSINRCNIFLNFTEFGYGYDLYAYECSIIDVIVDTFTVLEPNNDFAYPIDNFTFDILNPQVVQVNQDLYVSPSGSNINSGLNPDDPLLTVFYALIKIIADSTNPHTIHLANGTYSPSQTGETLPIYCKSFVSLQGEDRFSTILDGEGLSRIVLCDNDSCFSIENVTIKNGNAEYGGGIYCGQYVSTHLINLTIEENIASFDGAGIYCDSHSKLYITNVTIRENVVSDYGSGGGIYGSPFSSLYLNDVTICENAAYHGGGIFISWCSELCLTNVIIQENSAEYGGGIDLYESILSLTNVSIIKNNANNNGGGILSSYSNSNLINVTISGNTASGNGGGIYCKYNSNTSLINSILWNDLSQEIYFYQYGNPNTITISYSDIQGDSAGIVTNNNGIVKWLDGNIDTDPLFVDPDNGDYHFLSSSPCIDAGTPDTTGLNLPPFDLDGNPRIYNGIIDIGCYEWQGVGVDDLYNTAVCPVLYQNYPNPFSSSTAISFNLATDLRRLPQIRIYNIKGQLIRSLECGESLSAKVPMYRDYSILWDGKDENGKQLSNGIYFYKFVIENKEIATKKCLLLR